MEDNARKFIAESIDQDFLKENTATSFVLIVDWMITEEDSEKKVVCKKFENGEIQFLLVEKVIANGNRTTNKKKISVSEYATLLAASKAHIEKTRHEFTFVQDNVSFSVKYDQFKGEKLMMVEVDGTSETERNAFKIEHFPYKLTEVTGDMRYYGYRITSML